MKIIYYYFAIIILFFSNCLGQKSDLFKSVSVQQFAELLSKEQNLQLLDVRSTEEYANCHLDKSKNININGDNFDLDVQKLDKTKTVFVYCQAGGRSKKASKKLHELGFQKIVELDGGISDWTSNKMPTIK